jgi:Coenzyme PQQ synthesis protein D (PqqD)
MNTLCAAHGNAPDGQLDPLETKGPDAREVPVIRRGVTLVPLAESTALYDEIAQFVVTLNSSASEIWQRCDGSATTEEIVSDIAREYAADEQEVRHDVRATLSELRSLGLVRFSPRAS